MKTKYQHGKYYLENEKTKDFYIYDTKFNRGRAFRGEEVKEFTYQSAPKVVKAILNRGEKIIRSERESWEK